MTRHPDVPLWVSVGDVAANDGRVLHAGRAALLDQGQQRGLRCDRGGDCRAIRRRRGCTICPTADRYQVGPWRVAALGGTFAPSWYHTPAAALPPSRGRRAAAPSLKLGKSRDDKRRHFVRDEVHGLQGADRHRRLSDPRGAAPVLSGRPADRRRQDRDQRSRWRRCGPACTCSAITTSSPTRSGRACGPSASTSSPRRTCSSTATTLRCERVDT